MTGTPLDIALTKGIEALAGIVIQTVWTTGGGLWQQIRVYGTIRRQIFNATRRYVETYAERHGILKVLGMREPVKLETVYTGVKFLEQKGILRCGSLEILEASYREMKRLHIQLENIKKQDGLKIANQRRFLMVLGQPGAGKSTFLRRMGLEALKGRNGKYQPECIPVFIELKRFTTGEIDLEAVIIQEFKTYGFPKPETSARKLLERGKLLILLDGLDEVPISNLDTAMTRIQDFVDRHAQNHFIASCRSDAYHRNYRLLVDVEMADFDDAQIEQFISNWFQSETDRQMGVAQKCWNLLQQTEYRATKELAQTPLLLTLLCLVFDDSQSFPKNRAVLYGDALDVLLKNWAAEKRIQRDPIYQDLTTALEEMMLAEIAYKNFVEDRLFFSEPEVTDQIGKFLASNLNAPKHLDSQVILAAIQTQQGILVERARNVLSFSHLTLQEYLTAQHIVNHNGTQMLANRYLTDQRWREVFLLVAGLMRGSADQLLVQMQTAAQNLINTDNLKHLLQWSEQKTTGSEGAFKPAAKRIAAIVLALDLDLAFTRNFARARTLVLARARALDLTRTLDLTLDLDNDLDNDIILARSRALAFSHAFAHAHTRAHVLALALEFKKIKIFKAINLAALIAQLEALQTQSPGDDEPLEIRRAFADRIRQTWYDALHLDPEWVNLSEAEIAALNQYFYACELMVRCKEAAVRVSPQVWQGIEERMFTVQE